MRSSRARLLAIASATVLVLFSCSLVVTGADPYPTSPEHSTSKQEAATQGSEEQQESTNVAQAGVEDEKGEQELPSLVALIGARIHTMDEAGVIDDGVVLVQGKTILRVGDRSLEIPKEAQRIDVSGLTMTPGLIDARSRLWLTDASADAFASDASLNVLHGLDLFAGDWQDVVRHGVTAVYMQPSNRGTLGGFGAVVTAAESLLGPEVICDFAALQCSLGRGARDNRARAKQLDGVKKVLSAAKKYQEQWDEYDAYLKKQSGKKKASKDSEGDERTEAESDSEKKLGKSRAAGDAQSGRGRGPRPRSGSSRPANGKPLAEESEEEAKQESSKAKSTDEADEDEKEPPKKPEKDETKERLVKVIKGEVPLRLEVHNADDLHYAAKLIDEYSDLQVVLEGLSDLGSALSSVSEMGVPLVLGPWIEGEFNPAEEIQTVEVWGEKFSDYQGTVAVATSGTQASSSRFLRVHASRAMAAGFDRERVLAGITLDAARLLGIEEDLGSLSAGKRADLVCFAGDPLDASVPAKLVISAGDVVYRADSMEPLVESAAPVDSASLTELPSRYAIRSSNVLTADGSLLAGTIEVSEGRIVSVAKGSSDAAVGPVIDLGQAYVTPGLHAAHTTLGFQSLIDPDSQADAAYVVAGDVFSGDGKAVRNQVQNGLLSGLLAPGDSNPIAGTASLVSLSGRENVLVRLAAAKFCLTDSARSSDRFPSSLAGQQQLVRQSLNGSLLDDRLYLPPSVVSRLQEERNDVFESVVDGDRLVLLAVQSDAEIRAALDLIEQRKLKAALLGPFQLQPFIGRLAKLGTAVIAKPASVSDYDWYWQDLAAASEAGVPIYFSGESAEALRLAACLAVSAGMNREKALAALCNGPVDLISSPTLMEGAAADFVVWSDNPVNMAAKPLAVVTAGQVIDGSAEE